jgi:hypothetical protein
MKPRTIQQFAGESGKHTNPMGKDCRGRSFMATKVGIGGAYMNTVKCTLCEKELPAWEQGLLTESPISTIRKPTMSESAADDYRLQCGRIIQSVREVSPACVVIFDKTCAPERCRRLDYQNRHLVTCAISCRVPRMEEQIKGERQEPSEATTEELRSTRILLLTEKLNRPLEETDAKT